MNKVLKHLKILLIGFTISSFAFLLSFLLLTYGKFIVIPALVVVISYTFGTLFLEAYNSYKKYNNGVKKKYGGK